MTMCTSLFLCRQRFQLARRSSLSKAGRPSGFTKHFHSTRTSHGRRAMAPSASAPLVLRTRCATLMHKRSIAEPRHLRRSILPFSRNTILNMTSGTYGDRIQPSLRDYRLGSLDYPAMNRRAILTCPYGTAGEHEVERCPRDPKHTLTELNREGIS